MVAEHPERLSACYPHTKLKPFPSVVSRNHTSNMAATDDGCKPFCAALFTFATLFLVGFGEFLQSAVFMLVNPDQASFVWACVIFSIAVFYVTICFFYVTDGIDREEFIVRSLRTLTYGDT